MPIVYSNILKVDIDKTKKEQEKLNFKFNIDKIQESKVKINDKEEKGILFETSFVEEYDNGPSIKVVSDVLYLVPKQIADKVIVKANEKKIPKPIVDEVVNYVLKTNFQKIIKLGLEVGVKQPVMEPKIKVNDSSSKPESKKDSKTKESKKSKN